MVEQALLERLDACARGEPAPDTLWQAWTLAARYAVEEWLGEGTHGVVHRARDLETGALVVIKQMNSHWEAMNEARLLAALDHPSLVPLVDFLFDAIHAYLVQPYVPGWPLRAWTRGAEGEPRLLSLPEVLDIGKQLADVLHHLHHQPTPVIHRDVHSDNVIREPDGCIRLIDFTLAGRLDPDAPGLRSEISAELGGARSLLVQLAPPGTPQEIVWRLRGVPLPNEPFTAGQLLQDLAALEREVLGCQTCSRGSSTASLTG